MLNRNATASKGGVAVRLMLALVFLALIVPAGWHYLADRKLRQPSERFVNTYYLQERRPGQAEAIRLAQTADLGYGLVGDAAVRDAMGTVRIGDLDATTRELWLEVLEVVDKELAAAEALLLTAIAARPGWASHQSLLGAVDYLRADEGRPGARWLTVLRQAFNATPGDQTIRVFAASAIIESWNELEPSARAYSGELFRAAMADPNFVSRNYLSVAGLIGDGQAAALLPDSAPALNAAIETLAGVGDALAAAPIYMRWERAEWRERQLDLQVIRRRRQLNDFAGLQQACELWVRRHDVYAFDNPAGRGQVAEVLGLCPPTLERWAAAGGRAELIRFLRRGRTGGIDPAVFQNAIAAITDVPMPDAASIALAAGDNFGAEELASSAVRDPLGWTAFHVDLAWHHLRSRSLEDAAEALNQIPPTALRECEVALVRRAVAQASGSTDEVDSGVFLKYYPSDFWADAGVPICIDPAAGYDRLEIFLEVEERPVLISFGFDGGRSRTSLLAPGRRQIELPLEGRAGRHFFSYQVVAGGGVIPDLAVLE